MRELAEHVYFVVCLGLGRLLRAARYSKTRAIAQLGTLEVRKGRSFYAPLIISLGDTLVRILDTGVRVLPQREWEERERLMYERLYRASIRTEGNGTLLLPHLEGETLATLLEDPALGPAARRKAVELAVVALAEFHRQGFTHGDAMAENVMVDLDGGVARWFDFETVHDPSRPLDWRRADDVRALLASCLVRAEPATVAETLQSILEAYADEVVIRLLLPSFTSAWLRPLTFHLGQAPLSFQRFRLIARSLSTRDAQDSGNRQALPT